MARSPLLLLAILLAVVSTTLAAKAKVTCSIADISLVKSHVANSLSFCKFYISIQRSRTPITNLPAARLVKACKCIVKQGKEEISPNFTPATLSDRLAFPAPCVRDAIATLYGEVTFPGQLCNFYLALENTRTRKPILNLPVNDLIRACKCLKKRILVTTTKSRTMTAVSATSVTLSTSTTRTTTATTPTTSTSTSEATTTTTTAVTSTDGATTTTTTSDMITTTTTTTSDTMTTTTTQPFCSATAVQSLLADTGAYPFCWNVLAVPTSTTTITIFETPSETSIYSNHVPLTLTQTIRASTDRTTTIPTLTITEEVFSTMCVGSVPYKRDVTRGPLLQIRAPAQTIPVYLSNEPQNYLTSACDCIQNLSAPPAVTSASTSTLSTITVVTTLDVTDTFSTTVTTITGTNTLRTYLNTRTTTSINQMTPSGILGKPIATSTKTYTTNNVASTTTRL
ncbi:hypothetical protein C1H76_6438 [Elsinoe australis]|uniref:Uncharacterized protein n=1 Tax=Elsinoe australis TaxID=40998 RepID=A0A4U7AZW9_9PEZI|nr:hypothetical protein C1H76_6438 [Elsinoe australis]